MSRIPGDKQVTDGGINFPAASVGVKTPANSHDARHARWKRILCATHGWARRHDYHARIDHLFKQSSDKRILRPGQAEIQNLRRIVQHSIQGLGQRKTVTDDGVARRRVPARHKYVQSRFRGDTDDAQCII